MRSGGIRWGKMAIDEVRSDGVGMGQVAEGCETDT